MKVNITPPNAETLYKHQKLYEKRKVLFLNFFVVGLVTIAFPVTINSSAQIISKRFHKEDLMASFQIAQFACSCIMRIAHSKFFLRIPHKPKIISVVIFWTLAACSNFLVFWYVENDHLGFGLYITSTLVFGFFQALADLTTIGYMKAFPPEVISGYATGTGVGALVGGSLALLFGAMKWDYSYLCLAMAPLNFFMLDSFFRVVKIKNKVDFKWKIHSNHDSLSEKNLIKLPKNKKLSVFDFEEIKKQQNDHIASIVTIQDLKEAKINKTLSVETFKLAMKQAGWEIFNIFAVYYLEYLTITSFVERANPKIDDPSKSWIQRNAFTSINLGYQIGVFISRAGFSYVKFRKIGILTFLQAINASCFFLIALHKNINVYVQLGLMLFVGVMGGTSYVNSMYRILDKQSLKKSEKEIVVNFAALGYDMGILLSGVSALLVARSGVIN